MAGSANELQIMLKHVEAWCQKWRFGVNKEKTKVIHFRNKRRPRSNAQFLFDESNLEIVSSYKYLGITLSEYLDFNVTANVLAGAAGRALGAILAKFKEFGNVGFKAFTKLFESNVATVSEYASEVWGYGENVSCERIQQRASRFYLGVHPKTPTLALIGDIGWSTAQLKRHRNIMRYWNRLIQMDDTRLTKQIFLYDVNKCFGNWSSEVKSILNATGLEMIFDNLMLCNYKDTSKTPVRWTGQCLGLGPRV